VADSNSDHSTIAALDYEFDILRWTLSKL
jgi:hypothetical protein